MDKTSERKPQIKGEITLTLLESRTLYEEHFGDEMPRKMAFSEAAEKVLYQIGVNEFFNRLTEIRRRLSDRQIWMETGFEGTLTRMERTDDENKQTILDSITGKLAVFEWNQRIERWRLTQKED